MNLDRRIQFHRATIGSDGFGATETFAPHGAAVWAEKSDISDGERMRASEIQAHITSRFRVRSSDFTRGLSPKDRLVCEGLVYDISGIKEPPGTRRQWIEITASARNDQ